MKNKNLVFVTQRVEYIKKTGEFRDSLDERLIEWLKTNPRLTKGELTVEFEKKWADYIFLLKY